MSRPSQIHRHTFVLDTDQRLELDERSFVLEEHTATIRDVPATRELMVQLGELPEELRACLRGVDYLRITYVAPNSSRQQPLPPFVIDLPGGLHVQYELKHRDAVPLGFRELMESIIGSHVIDVPDFEQRFIKINNLEYLHETDISVAHMCDYLTQHIIDHAYTYPLDSTSSLSLTYTNNRLRLRALWTNTTESLTTIIERHHEDTVEVGIFESHLIPGVEDLTMSGLTAAIGDGNTQFKPTLISFPQRTRHLDTGYRSRLDPGVGMHPVLVTQITPTEPPAEECTLNALYTLPSPVFLDKYQLADRAAFKSGGVSSSRVWGETDLEAPVWAVDGWGSMAAVEVDWRGQEVKDDITVELPLHMRYAVPDDERQVEIQQPVVYWACENIPQSPLEENPFDTPQTLYTHLHPGDTTFHFLTPTLEHAMRIEVPTARTGDLAMARWGTMGAITLGMVWVSRAAARGWLRGLRSDRKGKKKE
ncbi:protease B nonderepressible form [Saitoella coloradoensis]